MTIRSEIPTVQRVLDTHAHIPWGVVFCAVRNHIDSSSLLSAQRIKVDRDHNDRVIRHSLPWTQRSLALDISLLLDQKWFALSRAHHTEGGTSGEAMISQSIKQMFVVRDLYQEPVSHSAFQRSRTDLPTPKEIVRAWVCAHQLSDFIRRRVNDVLSITHFNPDSRLFATDDEHRCRRRQCHLC